MGGAYPEIHLGDRALATIRITGWRKPVVVVEAKSKSPTRPCCFRFSWRRHCYISLTSCILDEKSSKIASARGGHELKTRRTGHAENQCRHPSRVRSLSEPAAAVAAGRV